MVNDGDWVAIFHSVHKVMKAEKLLKGAALPVLLIPVPRELSSDCGLAVRFADGARAAVLARLAEAGLEPQELYRLDAGRYRREP